MAVEPPYRVPNMMPGMIMLWTGAIVDIPSGWHLCDGTVNTPDLRNLFVVGAGDTYAPGDSDINPLHKHYFTGDGHSHSIPEGSGLAAGTDYALVTTEEPAVGSTNFKSSLPAYHALCYIMKLPIP